MLVGNGRLVRPRRPGGSRLVAPLVFLAAVLFVFFRWKITCFTCGERIMRGQVHFLANEALDMPLNVALERNDVLRSNGTLVHGRVRLAILAPKMSVLRHYARPDEVGR